MILFISSTIGSGADRLQAAGVRCHTFRPDDFVRFSFFKIIFNSLNKL